MVIWYDILFSIDMISKKLQTKSICIDATIKQVKSIKTYFEKYRNEGFARSVESAKAITFDMDVEPTFPIRRRVIRKRQFDETNNEHEIQSPEESFRLEYFIVVVDAAIVSLESRFEQLTVFEDIFGFLYDSKKLKSLDGHRT